MIYANHSWNENGIYNITVKAKDFYNRESDWSDPKAIHIIGAPSLEINNIDGGLFKVCATIKNNAGTDVTSVNWSIVLNGGFILMGNETSGTIPSIPAGDETEVCSSLILGFGKTVITVTAETSEYFDTKEQDAFVFLFFIMVNE